MKTILISVIVAFLFALGVLKYFDIQKDAGAERSKEDYDTYIVDESKDGEIFDQVRLQKYVSESIDTYLINDDNIKKYLSQDGYIFDLKQLTAKSRFGGEGDTNVFSTSIQTFGPESVRQWKSVLIPQIQGKPSDRMIAVKALRGLDQWSDQLAVLNDAVFDMSSKGNKVGFGLYQLRKLEVEDRVNIYNKLKAYLHANATLGKLSIVKSRGPVPFDIAMDMLNVLDMLYVEATEEYERELVEEIEGIIYGYIDNIIVLNDTGKYVTKLQNSLSNYTSLDDYFFNSARAFAFKNRAKTETTYTAMLTATKTSYSLFKDMNVMTEENKWESLLFATKVSALLYHNPLTDEAYEQVDGDIYQAIQDYVTENIAELDLNEQAINEVNRTLRTIETFLVDYAKQRLKRDKLNMLLAVEKYVDAKGKLPTSVSQITGAYLPNGPTNILTDDSYEGEFNYTPENKKTKTPESFKIDWKVNPTSVFEVKRL
ncbi:hypothetical protein OAB00_00255 [Akkermansiaceae bacterium]|nr:hypothetical protein [Akkermansiaceae bacterium]